MSRPKTQELRKPYKVRLLAAELATIQRNANAAGITVSEFIRRAVLKKRIRSRIKAQIIGQLSRLGGLQKHLLMQIRSNSHEDELREKLNYLLREIHTTLRAIHDIKEE